RQNVEVLAASSTQNSRQLICLVDQNNHARFQEIVKQYQPEAQVVGAEPVDVLGILGSHNCNIAALFAQVVALLHGSGAHPVSVLHGASPHGIVVALKPNESRLAEILQMLHSKLGLD